MNCQWHIFIASLDPSKGSEQAGKRPGLVGSREQINQLLPVVNVIPLTSKKSSERKIFPNEVLIPSAIGGLKMESIALCYQIRILDKTRLHDKVGEIKEESLKQTIRKALRCILKSHACKAQRKLFRFGALVPANFTEKTDSTLT